MRPTYAKGTKALWIQKDRGLKGLPKDPRAPSAEEA